MLLLWVSVLLSFLASMLGMFLAEHYLYQRIAIVGSFIGLARSLNPGIAFSIMLPQALQTPLILFALFLIVLLAMQSKLSVWSAVGFGIIIGGALGNIVDRLADGMVTDFIQVGSFPVFNIADSCITVGVILLLLDVVAKKVKR